MSSTDQVGAHFSTLGLDPRLIAILTAQGIDKPFPIQSECIPIAINSRDIMAQARTGSGKTLAFALPALHYILNLDSVAQIHDPEVLVLCPTRELCQQVVTVINNLGSKLGIQSMAIYGGTSYDDQIDNIVSGVDIVVATPGRLLDLIGRGSISLAQVKILVLDEADEMLDMGFIADVESILTMTDPARQTLLFSATLSGGVIGISRKYMRSPTRVTVGEFAESDIGVSSITQHVMRAHSMDKINIVEAALSSALGERTIIFSRTKRNAQRVCDDLQALGFTASAIHGDMNQSAREKSLESFTAGKRQVLVATDVAARGIHVDGVTLVINFECPDDEKSYTHRIGRTGRAGAVGVALTLVDWDDLGKWAGINGQLNSELPTIPPEIYSNSDVISELFPRIRPKSVAPIVAKSTVKSPAKRPVVKKTAARPATKVAKADAKNQPATPRVRKRTVNRKIRES